MKAIPTEFRERILEDCDNGLSERKAAQKWKVGRSTIAKIKKQRRPFSLFGGSIEPKQGKTGPKPKLAEHRGLLKQIGERTPDATLEALFNFTAGATSGSSRHPDRSRRIKETEINL